jgi:hypothetical protein
MDRFVFGRVGWMKRYQGPVAGDRPEGLMGHIRTGRNLGAEAYNFKDHSGRVFGYFPIKGEGGLNLQRIDPKCSDRSIDGVTVLLVSHKRGTRGQHIVGWYRDATVFDELQYDGPWTNRAYASAGWDGTRCPYLFKATPGKCRLLQEVERFSPVWSVPGEGPGEMKRTTVFYPYDQRGRLRTPKWITRILSQIRRYRPGTFDTPREGELRDFLTQARGQGWTSDPRERRTIEEFAMTKARKHFTKEGYGTDDVHSHQSYDLYCSKASQALLVEVKGTTTKGESVLLTPNELSLRPTRRGERRVLFIVPRIEVVSGRVRRAGRPRVIDPFDPDEYERAATGWSLDLAE